MTKNEYIASIMLEAADLLKNGASWQAVQTLLGRETGRESFESYIRFNTQELVTIYRRCHPRA